MEPLFFAKNSVVFVSPKCYDLVTQGFALSLLANVIQAYYGSMTSFLGADVYILPIASAVGEARQSILTCIT